MMLLGQELAETAKHVYFSCCHIQKSIIWRRFCCINFLILLCKHFSIWRMWWLCLAFSGIAAIQYVILAYSFVFISVHASTLYVYLAHWSWKACNQSVETELNICLISIWFSLIFWNNFILQGIFQTVLRHTNYKKSVVGVLFDFGFTSFLTSTFCDMFDDL